MNKLPDYINCENKRILFCEWYMSRDCPETCAYAKNTEGLGVGALCREDVIRIKNG